MNEYKEKQEAKKQRYLDLADSADNESSQRHQAADKLSERFYMGQPILVGHHSEKSARSTQKRMHNNMDKSIEASKKADYYRQKAASVGTGGISSDDPEAIQQLKEQLQKKEELQSRMKAANKVIRGKTSNDQKSEELQKQGFTEKTSAELLKGDFCGRLGFASYQLTNNNANIKRIKSRIKDLESINQRDDVEEKNENYTYLEEDNRCQFVFDGKPADEIRQALKSNAFKWSPSRGAWVRQLTGNGQWAAKQVKTQLNELFN